MKKPKQIYKYEGIDGYGLLNLKRSGIYFNSPSNFNDPFDYNLGFSLEFDDSKLEKYRTGQFPFDDERPPAIQDKFNNTKLDELKQVLRKTAKDTIEINIQSVLQNVGIACFSEVNDNLLMWSHYASSCKGFCLEFDTNFEPFTKLYKVDYATEYPVLDAVEILSTKRIDEDNLGEYSKLWLTKSVDWSYEKEWRAVHQSKGTLFTYPQDAIKSVFFGPLIDQAYLEIICLVIQGQNRNVRFYRGSKSKEEFKVEFAEFKYLPHIQAKEQGIIK